MTLATVHVDSTACLAARFYRHGALVAGVGLALLFAVHGTVAQPLDKPVRTATCDPVSTPRYQAGSDLEAVCERRTYRIANTDTVALAATQYGDVVVEAWDSSAVAVEATIVTRKPTRSDAEAALPRVRLRREDGAIRAEGPADDASGWWSVGYRLRVPRQTTLDVTTYSGSIQVRGVAGGHRLTSDHGALTLHLRPGTGARLQAETDYGTINVGFPVTTQGAITERLDTVVGDGGPAVQLATGSDITIRRDN